MPQYFSVVIPLYNKEVSIRSTVESVLNQTYPYFELIIVNDGSTDNSLDEVNSIQDERIRVITKINGGVSSARNHGIENSNFEWIAFLDGDDLWFPIFLETIHLMIEKYSEASIFSSNYSINGVPNLNSYKKEGYIEDYFKIAINYPIICSSAVCIKKECFNTIGGFKEYLKHGEDLEMWARLTSNFKIAFIPNSLVIYRVNTENRACHSDSKFKKEISNNWSIQIRKKSFNKNSWLKYYEFIILRESWECMIKEFYSIRYFFKAHGFLFMIKVIIRSVYINKLKRISKYF